MITLEQAATRLLTAVRTGNPRLATAADMLDVVLAAHLKELDYIASIPLYGEPIPSLTVAYREAVECGE
jgi:hypothetical protein